MIGGFHAKLEKYRAESTDCTPHATRHRTPYACPMHDPRPIAHALMFSDLAAHADNAEIEITADEAHHAVKVKRVGADDRVLVLDGQGRTADARVIEITGARARPALRLLLDQVQHAPPTSPRVEVLAALPKGDRLDRMIDQLAQLGVAAFRPLRCERSQRKPDSARPDKLTRIAQEAIKQCRCPWAMQIGDPIAFTEAIADPDAVLADATGSPWGTQDLARQRVVLLIGPEGGWSDAERQHLDATQTSIRRFGQYVMRLETAACAAAAIVLAKP